VESKRNLQIGKTVQIDVLRLLLLPPVFLDDDQATS
jgi:hypothetical protein